MTVYFINTKVHYVIVLHIVMLGVLRNQREIKAGGSVVKLLAYLSILKVMVRFNVKTLFTKVWRIVDYAMIQNYTFKADSW